MNATTYSRRAGRPARAVAILAIAVAAFAGRAVAQEGSLPADMQVQLLSKILRFDRNLNRYGGEVVLGFLYQAGNRESGRLAQDLNDAAHSIHAVGAGNQGFRTVLLPYAAGNDLRAELRREHVSLLYVSAMRAVDLRHVVEQAHEAGILTIAGDAEPIQAGVAIALKERGPRPAIAIRLASARKVGSDFDSGLLRLVEVQQ